MHILPPMPRRFVTLAWIAAASAYLLIVLGAVVRISGSGMGCGDHWPLCNGHLFPSLNDIPTVIEWSHRLVAAVVSILVIALVVLDWRRAWPVLALLIVQVLLGAVTVKTGLTPVLVILHLATAMLLLAALIVSARGVPGPPPGLRPGSAALLALTFITVLFGALTANLGAIAACHGFPLCNGQIVPQGGWLPAIHWTHRLLAYTLTGYAIWWAARSRDRAAWRAVAIVVAQIAIAVTMLNLGFANGLRAAHAAVGAGVWVAMLFVSLKPTTDPAAVAS